MKIVRIYVLIDPVTSEKRYVGKTIDQLSDRLKVHLFQSKNSKKPTYKEAWIKGLLLNNKKPLVELLEECNESNWAERERHWIAFAKETGWPITNLSDGGDGPHGVRHSEEFKNALREKMKGNRYGQGKTWTAEQRQVMMQQRIKPWNKGKIGLQSHDEEWRKAASERMSGENHPMVKLTDDHLKALASRYENGERIIDLAKEAPVSYSHLRRLLKNKTNRLSCVQ